MKILYTAREIFDSSNSEEVTACLNGSCIMPSGNHWENYISWSRLYHLKELISLDVMLNNIISELDDKEEYEYWDYIVTDDIMITGFFSSLDYVLRMTQNKERFNLMAVVIEPSEDCKDVQLDGFDLIGYELLDIHYDISALTNCGGFDETFLPSELNPYGLLDDWEKAYDIKKRLLENNPEQSHALTNLVAVWRHKSIGR